MRKNSKKNILVLFNARYNLPLRTANHNHLSCWSKWSKHNTIYINIAYGFPERLIRSIHVHAIIFDTLFLSMHWSPNYFIERTKLCEPLKSIKCTKIAIIQDEFYNIDLVQNFLNDINITDILTCSESDDWNYIYDKIDREKVNIRTVLTGYVEANLVAKINNIDISKRPIDVGYRAWQNPFWLGEHGQEKVNIGKNFVDYAKKEGLNIDVNNPDANDFYIGKDWFGFLQQCKAVLGVEGGASVIDKDGTIKVKVEKYLQSNPAACFEECRNACFTEDDGLVNLKCLSPRHFEACMTKTCQILLEGKYSGVLKAWEHFLPLKSDYSNIVEIIETLKDTDRIQQIVDKAYDDIVLSGAWSYEKFVNEIEESILEKTCVVKQSSKNKYIYSNLALFILSVRNNLLWLLAHIEAPIVKYLRKIKKRVVQYK